MIRTCIKENLEQENGGEARETVSKYSPFLFNTCRKRDTWFCQKVPLAVFSTSAFALRFQHLQ